MEIVKKRYPREIALGILLLSHPIPVLFHILAVALFTLIAASPQLTWSIILFVISAHAAMQVSIAMINDYCDRRLDAASKPGKPLPRGLVLPREALIGGLLMIAIMILLLLPLPRLSLLISLCYLALGQAYNLGLKSTPLSGVVFALAIPLIPLYAFAGVGRTFPLLFWFVPLGFLFGVALNLANALTDLEEDAAQGARTLAVVLGVRGSFLACHLLMLAATILIGLLTIRSHPLSSVVTLILALLLISAMLLFFGPEKTLPSRKLHFYLVILTCLLLAGGWLIGVLA